MKLNFSLSFVLWCYWKGIGSVAAVPNCFPLGSGVTWSMLNSWPLSKPIVIALVVIWWSVCLWLVSGTGITVAKGLLSDTGHTWSNSRYMDPFWPLSTVKYLTNSQGSDTRVRGFFGYTHLKNPPPKKPHFYFDLILVCSLYATNNAIFYCF